MRRLTIQLCLLCPVGMIAPAALAQTTAPAEPARRAELAAATQDALEALRQQVLDASVAPDLTVRQLVERLGGSETLIGGIDASAEQRGGTRWRDEQTCEIRMALAGNDVADVLGKVVADRHDQLAAMDLRPDSLKGGLTELRAQTFSALGRSTGAASLDRVRPPAGMWQNVPDKDRLAAVTSAKALAVARVIESLRPLDIGSGKRMGDALDVPELREEVRRWVDARPVTSFLFGEDFTVRLTLSAPPDALWPVVRSALSRQKLGPAADDEKAWDDLRQRLARGIGPATGRGALPAADPLQRANRAAPAPPAWAADQMNADGSVSGRGLRAARAAEAAALETLRTQLESLPLHDGKTVGEVAKTDPRVKAALAEAVRRAQISKITYGPDAVQARVSLDLARVWRDLEDVR